MNWLGKYPFLLYFFTSKYYKFIFFFDAINITKWIIGLENLEDSHKHFVQLCAAGVEVPDMIASLRVS